MSTLELSSLTKRFGADTVVDAIDLRVEQGAMYCLLGPSGCGKTTLLRMIGGYVEADAGNIHIDGEAVTALPPERRSIGMVFQNYALFPHMSAHENVAFGLRARRMTGHERRSRVEAMLERVGLSARERASRPAQLSGGQQQRVALARALMIEPNVLLLDEPMANLDKGLREQMREEIRELQQRTGVTTVFVTHDQEEALSMASHLGVMMHGRLIQSGTPDSLYNRPNHLRVARFLGETNLLYVQRRDASTLHLQGGLTLPRTSDAEDACMVMIRPECIRLANGSGEDRFMARVSSTTFMGADIMLELRLADDTRLRMRSRRSEIHGIRVDETLALTIAPYGAWPLPADDTPQSA